jgi:hypothetical protein
MRVTVEIPDPFFERLVPAGHGAARAYLKKRSPELIEVAG